MTMENDYENYELEYEDETGIPAYECDSVHFQRWFEDKLLGKDLAKIRNLLEELSKEKDLQSRLDSQSNANSVQSPKELIEAILNYEVLKALNILQSGQIEKKHIGKDLLSICDEAINSLIDIVAIDAEGGSKIGKGIRDVFSYFIDVDYNAQGFKDYSGEARKQLKKCSVYKLKEILESIIKGESMESALHNSIFYDKNGKFKPKHKELSFIPLNFFELKILVEIEEVKLGQIDLSYIKSLSALFANCAWWDTNRKDFSGIEQWDTSKINDMSKLFAGLEDFKADLSKWNVSRVKNFYSMFSDCEAFESDLSKWKPKKAEDIAFMFEGAKSFTSNLDDWNISKEVVENAKGIFKDCPISQNPPLWYKAVFDMDNPSVDLLYKLIKIRDYERAKECLLKLPPLNKAEYTECARLCFYMPPGVVGIALPDKDFFTTLVNQAKSQNIVIPISNEVMSNCAGFDKFEYVEYLITLGYKIIVDRQNSFSIGAALQKPIEKVRDKLLLFLDNCGNTINQEFFEAIEFTHRCMLSYRDKFNEETLDVFFKELLARYPKETFTDKKMLSFFVNRNLIYILSNNGIEVDLQGVEYEDRIIDSYYLKTYEADAKKRLSKFLQLLELNLLQADTILEYYHRENNSYKDTYRKAAALLVFVYKFKNKLMRNDKEMPMQEILKQFAKNGIDAEKLGTYGVENLYEILEDSEHKEEVLSLLKIK